MTTPLIRQQPHVQSPRWHWLVLLAVLVLALAPRVIGLDVFLTADEDDQIRFASGFLRSVLAQDWAGAVLLGYPGVPTMAFSAAGLGARYLLHTWGVAPLPGNPAGLDTALADALQYPLTYIPPARAVMATMAALGVVLIYLLLRRLVGVRVALVAAVLVAFDPMFLANSRILHVDAPLTYFMFLSFLAFWVYLREGRWGWLALSGVCGALAVLSKTPGALLGPILIVTGLVYALHAPTEAGDVTSPLPHRGRWRRFLLALVVWAGVAVIAFFAMWPSMWTDPTHAVGWLIDNATIAMQTNHPSSGVFWGFGGGDRSPFYYLISLPFHLTPLGTLGLLLGIFLTVRWRQQRPLLLSLWAFVVLFLIPVSLAGRRGDRYILPLFLPLDVMTALALTWLSERLRPATDGLALPSRRVWAVGAWLRQHVSWVVGLALAAQSLSVILLYPYYFDYFNPLLGGGRTAPQFVNIGWGEGLDRAAAYLNQLPGVTEQTTVAAWYGWQFAPFFKGKTIDLSGNEPALTADYVVFYINQLQRGFPSRELLDYFRDRQPVHRVRLNSVDYALIYPGPIIGSALPREIQHPVDVTFGGAVHLLGYDLARDGLHTDDPVHVTLYWQVLAPIAEDHNVYIRLMDDSGNVFGQVDRLPIGGLWRTNMWQPGRVIRDEYSLRLRPGAPPDVYHMEVAMYEFETGETFGVARNIGQLEYEPAANVPLVEDLNIANPARTALAPGLELLGYELGLKKLGPGERLPVTLYWRATSSISTDYGVLFEARSVAGNEGGSWTDRLGSVLYPTSLWRRGEVQVSIHQLQMPPNARSGIYVLNVRLLDTATGATAGREILGKLEFVERARSFETPSVQYAVGADLNGVAQLIGYDLPQTTVRAGEAFPLTLYWRALGQTTTSYAIFIHVLGPDGSIRGQWDSIPGAGTLPTTGWVKGEVITDQYMVPMQPDAPPWEYTIVVGMYDPQTGQRLPVVGDAARDTIVLRSVKGE